MRRRCRVGAVLLGICVGTLDVTPAAVLPDSSDSTVQKTPPASRVPVDAHVPGRDGVTFPFAVLTAPPKYPLAAMRDEIEAQVELLVNIDDHGAVGAVEVLNSSAPEHGFEAAAKLAVAAWEYRPALLDGKPVEVYTVVTVGFVPDRIRDDRRWAERQDGLRSFAANNLYADAPQLVGQDGVSAPILLKKRASLSSSYPVAARKRGIDSRVLLLVEVTSEGRIDEVPLVHAENHGHGFAAAAEQHVRQWRFTPATKDGVTVDVWHWVEVAYTSSP